MIRVLVAAVSMMGLVGCAGSADGKVAGHSLAVADAIFGTLKDNSGKNIGLAVFLADKPNLCDSLKANRQPKGATFVQFSLFRIGDNEVLAPDVAEYTVKEGLSVFAKGNNASVAFDRQDSSCATTIGGGAGSGKSGLIKLTNLKSETGGTANATFDVTFGDGSLKGSFNAQYCDLNSLSDNPNCE